MQEYQFEYQIKASDPSYGSRVSRLIENMQDKFTKKTELVYRQCQRPSIELLTELEKYTMDALVRTTLFDYSVLAKLGRLITRQDIDKIAIGCYLKDLQELKSETKCTFKSGLRMFKHRVDIWDGLDESVLLSNYVIWSILDAFAEQVVLETPDDEPLFQENKRLVTTFLANYFITCPDAHSLMIGLIGGAAVRTQDLGVMDLLFRDNEKAIRRARLTFVPDFVVTSNDWPLIASLINATYDGHLPRWKRSVNRENLNENEKRQRKQILVNIRVIFGRVISCAIQNGLTEIVEQVCRLIDSQYDPDGQHIIYNYYSVLGQLGKCGLQLPRYLEGRSVNTEQAIADAIVFGKVEALVAISRSGYDFSTNNYESFRYALWVNPGVIEVIAQLTPNFYHHQIRYPGQFTFTHFDVLELVPKYDKIYKCYQECIEHDDVKYFKLLNIFRRCALPKIHTFHAINLGIFLSILVEYQERGPSKLSDYQFYCVFMETTHCEVHRKYFATIANLFIDTEFDVPGNVLYPYNANSRYGMHYHLDLYIKEIFEIFIKKAIDVDNLRLIKILIPFNGFTRKKFQTYADEQNKRRIAKYFAELDQYPALTPNNIIELN